MYDGGLAGGEGRACVGMLVGNVMIKEAFEIVEWPVFWMWWRAI